MTAVAAVLSPVVFGLAAPAVLPASGSATSGHVVRSQPPTEADPRLVAPSPRGAKLWVDPGNAAARAAAGTAARNPAQAGLLRKISSRPQATWLGEWVPTSAVATRVAATSTRAAAGGGVPVFVVYGAPVRDCGGYAAGGLATPAGYRAWVDQVARGLAGRRAVVVVEPDALASMDCLTSALQQVRIALISYAVDALRRNPKVSVYLDAGNARWQPAEVMAARLRAAGVLRARGFALNVSNFDTTTSEVAYGKRIDIALGGPVPFVVDTSRNGRGPYAGTLDWCNPPGRALGSPPTTMHAEPLVDALLWVKVPGESDGLCRDGPFAGTWWQAYALGLASRATW